MIYYFWASYCGYCKWARNEIIEPLNENGAGITLINAMNEPNLAIRYKVKKIPTLILTDEHGAEISRLERHEINEKTVKAMLGN